MENLFFVYYKDNKVKILSRSQAINSKGNLSLEGWKHTATINPAVLLEYLHNDEGIDLSWQSLHETLTKLNQ